MNKDQSSIAIGVIDQSLFAQMREIVDSFFDEDEVKYCQMNLADYREIMLNAQQCLVENGFPSNLVRGIKASLSRYLDTSDFLVQSSLYLRASRPQKYSPAPAESIGWHRESFYGQGMEYSANIWVPLRGVNDTNTLRYIPKSQVIPDEEIVFSQHDDPYTRQYGVGHRLGFLYKPKRIMGGVDLTSSQFLDCSLGRFAVFSGNLVHGNAINNSKKIRLSIDFRIIRSEHHHLTKPRHFASQNKPYFVDI